MPIEKARHPCAGMPSSNSHPSRHSSQSFPRRLASLEPNLVRCVQRVRPARPWITSTHVLSGCQCSTQPTSDVLRHVTPRCRIARAQQLELALAASPLRFKGRLDSDGDWQPASPHASWQEAGQHTPASALATPAAHSRSPRHVLCSRGTPSLNIMPLLPGERRLFRCADSPSNRQVKRHCLCSLTVFATAKQSPGEAPLPVLLTVFAICACAVAAALRGCVFGSLWANTCKNC